MESSPLTWKIQLASSNIRVRRLSLRRGEACDGQRCADDPAHVPGGAYTAIAHVGGEQEREHDVQYEVAEGGDFEHCR